MILIGDYEIEGHDGHNVAFHNSKTTGIKHVVCHTCEKSLKKVVDCEVYSRPCGYLAPTSRFNDGKMAEFKARKNYKVQ